MFFFSFSSLSFSTYHPYYLLKPLHPKVGHIFRSFHPYTFPGNKDTHGINTARTVEVWMEEYKRHFYMHRPDLLNSDIGSVTNRQGDGDGEEEGEEGFYLASQFWSSY